MNVQKTLNARILRGTQETAITQLEKELKELDTNMKLANSPGMKKQDRENSKTLKNFMMSQDEYLRLVNKETEDIQCKFYCKVGCVSLMVVLHFVKAFLTS